MESQPISSNYKFENGVTESMLEPFVNRNTFSEHKMDLVDKKFIRKNPLQSDKRTWTYYDTTPLGKVWAIKHIFSNSPSNVLVSAGPGTGKSRIPQLMYTQGIQNYILLDNPIHFKRARKIKRDEIVRQLDSNDLLFFFYQQLPRMKKHPSQYPNDKPPLELNALKHAFFNLSINSRMTFKPHKVTFTELEGSRWTWKQQLKAEAQPKSRTEIIDHVFPQIQKHGSKWRVLNMTKKDFMAINADHPFWKKTEEQRRELESQQHYYTNAMEVINEYGIEVNFPVTNKIEVKIIKYFRVDDDEYVKKMYDYIFDSLTFLLLINLEKMQKTIDEDLPHLKIQSVGKRTNVKKILEDPDLRSFYQQYKMERQQDLQESLNFLSDDN